MRLFSAYSGAHPATVCINGHRLVVLSTQREELEENLHLFDADSVHLLGDADDDVEELARSVGEAARADVFIAPEELTVEAAMKQLESHLPWCQ